MSDARTRSAPPRPLDGDLRQQRQQPGGRRDPGRRPRLEGVRRGQRRGRRAVQGGRRGARRRPRRAPAARRATTSTPSPRARTRRARSRSGSRRRRRPRARGATAGSPARSTSTEHRRGVGRGVRRGDQRDAGRRVVGRGGRGGGLAAAGGRRGRDGPAPAEFDDDARGRSTRPSGSTAERPVPRVAYTGEPGAFAEEAVLRFFAAPEAVALSSFRAVFEAVRDGEADAGVVPVESSLLGTHPREPRPAVGVRAADRGRGLRPGAARAAGAARARRSSRSSASTRSPRRSPRPTSSCARGRGASRRPTTRPAPRSRSRERGERGAAAVASARVAAIYGLEVLADDIQSRRRQPHPVRGDRAGGRRKPAVRAAAPAGGRPAARRGRRSCSPCATCRGRCTARWAPSPTRGLNLSRLESRPWTARGVRWEYLFWVDLDADPADPRARRRSRSWGPRHEVRPDPGTYRRAPPRTRRLAVGARRCDHRPPERA